MCVFRTNIVNGNSVQIEFVSELPIANSLLLRNFNILHFSKSLRDRFYFQTITESFSEEMKSYLYSFSVVDAIFI